MTDEKQTAAPPSVVGHAFTDDHWSVTCPHCEHECEYTGYFDADDPYKCQKCRKVFTCRKIVFENEDYIE